MRLKAESVGPLHGYDVLRRIQQIAGSGHQDELELSILLFERYRTASVFSAA
jgi:hypothetical protein